MRFGFVCVKEYEPIKLKLIYVQTMYMPIMNEKSFSGYTYIIKFTLEHNELKTSSY